jgi:hypothetical protein
VTGRGALDDLPDELFELHSNVIEIFLVANANQSDENGDELVFVEILVRRRPI